LGALEDKERLHNSIFAESRLQKGGTHMKTTLLVVDDDMTVHEVLREVLSQEYEIIDAYNGKEALVKYANHQKEISLILLDMEMPDKTGIEVLEEFKMIGLESIPVVVLTANTECDIEYMSIEAGAIDYIRKPINAKVVKVRIAAHIALRQNISDLEEQREAQRYFFAAASHELKTPNAAITTLLQGMLDNVGVYQDHPKYLWECLKMMGEQNKIISEILEVVNLSDRKIMPVFETVLLREVVEAMLPRYRSLAERNDLNIDVQIPKEISCVADYALLSRALSNIAINAIQNTPEQGLIKIWTEAQGTFIRLCIQNSGAQISEDILPRLFDPFFRADRARTASNGQSGLGLTIVSMALSSMEVTFAIENVPEGVRFWVELPR